MKPKYRTLFAVTLAIALSGVFTACTPEQIAAFNAAPADVQQAILAGLNTPRAEMDCYTAMRQVWPSETHAWARTIIKRESRNIPTAQNRRSSAAGCFQTLRIHAPRFANLGYTWEHDRYNALANTRVAYDLYKEQGTRPWQL